MVASEGGAEEQQRGDGYGAQRCDQHRRGGHVFGALYQRVIGRRDEIADGLYRGVDGFEDQHQGDRQDEDGDFDRRQAEQEGEGEREGGGGEVNEEIGLRSQEREQAFEGKTERPADAAQAL